MRRNLLELLISIIFISVFLCRRSYSYSSYEPTPHLAPTQFWIGGLRGESKDIGEGASSHFRQPRQWLRGSRAAGRRYTRSISRNPGTPCLWSPHREFETKPAECANTRARRCWRNDNPGRPAAAQHEPAPGRSSLPASVFRPVPVFHPPS